MALNLAQEFKDTAEKGLPDWEAQQALFTPDDRITRSMDIEDSDDIPDEDLKLLNPALYAMRRAAQEQIQAQSNELDDKDKRRQEEKEAEDRHEDDMHQVMSEAAIEAWKQETIIFGGYEMTNGQMMEYLNTLDNNFETIYEAGVQQGVLNPEDHDATEQVVEQASQAAEDCNNGDENACQAVGTLSQNPLLSSFAEAAPLAGFQAPGKPAMARQDLDFNDDVEENEPSELEVTPRELVTQNTQSNVGDQKTESRSTTEQSVDFSDDAEENPPAKAVIKMAAVSSLESGGNASGIQNPKNILNGYELFTRAPNLGNSFYLAQDFREKVWEALAKGPDTPKNQSNFSPS